MKTLLCSLSRALRMAVRGGAVLTACFLGRIGSAQQIPITGVTLTSGTLGASGAASSGLLNLIDGSFANNSYQQFLGPSSVTMDMGSVQSVDRLVVVGRFATPVPNVSVGTVEVSSDGVNWTPVNTFTNTDSTNVGGTTLVVPFAPQLARYVRLDMTSATANEQISELQLYNGTGPRLSLVDHSANLSTAQGAPFSIVDQNPTTFSLFSTTPTMGYFTVRLDSPEYASGWQELKLDVRSFPSPNPSNPGILTIYAGNSLGSLTQIYQKAEDEAPSNQSYDILLDQVYNYKYVEVSWDTNPDWIDHESNVQIIGFDVLPIPEPRTALIFGAGMAIFLARGKFRKLA